MQLPLCTFSVGATLAFVHELLSTNSFSLFWGGGSTAPEINIQLFDRFTSNLLTSIVSCLVLGNVWWVSKAFN